jgi:integrase
MPRRALGPRLYLDRRRKTWAIRDGSTFVRTQCSEGDRPGAEKALAEYIANKYQPEPSNDPLITDILTAYGREHAPHTRATATAAHTIGNLLKWWSDKKLSDVTARACRAYAATRPKSAARRDLETLRAAINYWHKEYGPLPSVPFVTLPDKEQPRDRWLTRKEAAKLLWAARRVPHLYRFILIGLYTGSRAGSILALKWEWVDVERQIMRRRAPGESESNKRRPPVRLGARLVSHLRRWRDQDLRVGIAQVVHYNGAPVRKLRRSWTTARDAARLDRAVTPHTLRHTRATWLMQAGVSPWEASGSLGMSVQVLEKTYGHHHPDWQKAASEV